MFTQYVYHDMKHTEHVLEEKRVRNEGMGSPVSRRKTIGGRVLGYMDAQ